MCLSPITQCFKRWKAVCPFNLSSFKSLKDDNNNNNKPTNKKHHPTSSNSTQKNPHETNHSQPTHQPTRGFLPTNDFPPTKTGRTPLAPGRPGGPSFGRNAGRATGGFADLEAKAAAFRGREFSGRKDIEMTNHHKPSQKDPAVSIQFLWRWGWTLHFRDQRHVWWYLLGLQGILKSWRFFMFSFIKIEAFHRFHPGCF